MNRLRPVFLALAGAIALLGACDQSDDTSPAEEVAEEIETVDPAVLARMPEGVSGEMLSDGRELFVVCTVCHGLDANGTQLGPSLRDSTWTHIEPTIPEIVRITREGVRSPREFEIPMPVMGGGSFTEDQLQAVGAYVYAMSQNEM